MKNRRDAAFATSPRRGEDGGEGPLLPETTINKSSFRSTSARAPAPHPPYGHLNSDHPWPSPFGRLAPRKSAILPICLPAGEKESCATPLHHQLLDFRDRLGRIQPLRTGARAIHDGVATVQLERIFQIVQPLAGGLVEIGRAHV